VQKTDLLEKISIEAAFLIATALALAATVGRILQRRKPVPYGVAVGMCLSSSAACATAMLGAFEWAPSVGRAGVIVIGITGGVLGMGFFELLMKIGVALAGKRVNITLEEDPKENP
jgi:hypothetical protein